MRKELFPELLESYREWVDGADLSRMQRLIEQGRSKWLKTGEAILELYREKGLSAGESISRLVA